MEWCDLYESGLLIRIAAFESFGDLVSRFDEVRGSGLAVVFEEGIAYALGRMFVTERETMYVPYYVPEEGVLAGSIGLVTPSIEQPRFHAIERMSQGFGIVGQSPLAIPYDRFVQIYAELFSGMPANRAFFLRIDIFALPNSRLSASDTDPGFCRWIIICRP